MSGQNMCVACSEVYFYRWKMDVCQTLVSVVIETSCTPNFLLL